MTATARVLDLLRSMDLFAELPDDELARIARLLKERNFAIANTYYFLFGFVLYGSTVLIPQMLQSLFGYTAPDSLYYWPAGGCHSSTLFLSGSMTQANFPYSDSSIFSSTLQPSSRKALTSAWRSSTR